MATQQNNGQVEEKLDYVRRGEPITADAWNKLVARANKPLDVSIVRTRRAKSSDGVEIRLAQLTTGLVWDSTARIYKATARYYDNGRPDTSGYTFDVYAPAISSNTTASRYTLNTRVWIIARNDRWELLETNDPLTRSVTAGLGISVGDADTSYLVSNTGLVEAKVNRDTSYTQSGTLFFSRRMFEWVAGELDSSTKVLGVRYKQVQVVTDVELRNGALDVTKSEIVVIDYQYG